MGLHVFSIAPRMHPATAGPCRPRRPYGRTGDAASGVTALALVDVAADLAGDSQRPLLASERAVPLPVARPLALGDLAGTPRLVDRRRAGQPVFVDVEGAYRSLARPHPPVRPLGSPQTLRQPGRPDGRRGWDRPARSSDAVLAPCVIWDLGSGEWPPGDPPGVCGQGCVAGPPGGWSSVFPGVCVQGWHSAWGPGGTGGPRVCGEANHPGRGESLCGRGLCTAGERRRIGQRGGP